MSIIVKNGQTIGPGDVQISVLGDLNMEVTKLSYSVKQAHKSNYSIGSVTPTSYSVGKKEFSCTLGLRFSSIQSLEKAAGGSLLDIKPFNIVATYVNEENEIVTDRILVKFLDQGREITQDSEDITKEFEMFCLGIEFNK
ncbi:MAG: hypothetical protein II956_14385 [Bacteroidales bacterium]|nr:hypothetical protein [Bacteroidales bacterium]